MAGVLRARRTPCCDSHTRSSTLITDETSPARDGRESKAVAMTIAPLFLNPYTPVGWTVGGTPVYPAQGGRGGGGIQFAVGDDDGEDPQFDDEQDDDDGDDDRLPASMRGKASRAKSARGRAQADDDDDDDDDDQDDDADEDDQDDDGWTPPNREAYERLTTALKRANGEAGKRRRVGKVMDKLGIDDLETWLTTRGIDPATGRPIGSDVIDPDADDDAEGDGYGPDGDYEREDDVRRPSAADDRKRDREAARQLLAAEQRGRRAERDTMMPILAEYAARTALRDAGFVGTQNQLDRALRTIDPEDLSLDLSEGDFELIGIEEAIAGLREDFPAFFETPAARRTRETRPNNARAARPRSGARDVDGGDRGRQPRKPRTWAEQMVEQMEKRGR